MFKLELSHHDLTTVVSALVAITNYMPDSETDVNQTLKTILEQVANGQTN